MRTPSFSPSTNGPRPLGHRSSAGAVLLPSPSTYKRTWSSSSSSFSVVVPLVVVFVLVMSMIHEAETATGTNSYRIRARPPAHQQQQQQRPSTGGGRSPNNSPSSSNRNWQDVYIAGFLALSDHEIEAPLGQGVMPAITLALRHLANSSFLHDYRLRLLYNDTQVRRL